MKFSVLTILEETPPLLCVLAFFRPFKTGLVLAEDRAVDKESDKTAQ